MLQREALEASPLADLHELAAEKGLAGFRKLRKADLIDALLGDAPAQAPSEAAPAKGRGRGRKPAGEAAPEAPQATPADGDDDEDSRPRRSRGRSRGRRRDDDAPESESPKADDRGGDAEREIEGVVEVLANGTAFIRVAHPDTSADDVYVSAAQVRRCELSSGDKVAGPYRQPRRSEKYPSLVRVERINGRPADEVTAEAAKFDDQAATYPTQRFELGGDDVTLKAIEWLAPIGRGSRAVIHGGLHAGKTEALRLLGAALAKVENIDLQLVLAGARPEEVTAWKQQGTEAAAVAPLGSSLEAQTSAIERAIDHGKKVARGGGDAVVLVDSLGELAPHVARRLLAAARNLVEGGSLTIIATANAPVGGETTLIALDPQRAGDTRFDLSKSTTLRADLLVGEEGAAAIAKERAKA